MVMAVGYIPDNINNREQKVIMNLHNGSLIKERDQLKKDEK